MSLEQRDQDIIKDYIEGKSAQSLGDKHGITRERVRQILIDNGIELRSPGPVASKVGKNFGKLTTKEKFMSLIVTIPDALSGDHWRWTGNTYGKYGRFRIGGKIRYAHYAAHFIQQGSFPKTRIYQTCAVEHCVHPDHWKPKA